MCWRNSIGGALVALYGALALLGHGGVHAVEHIAAHAHHHGSAARHVQLAGVSGRAEAAHAHHADCCRQHSHRGGRPATDGIRDKHPPHPSHEPHQHDHDNCSICQFFAAGALVLPAPAPLNLSPGFAVARASAASWLEGCDDFTLPIRGPPAAAA